MGLKIGAKNQIIMSLKRYLGKGYQFDGLFLFDFIYILW